MNPVVGGRNSLLTRCRRALRPSARFVVNGLLERVPEKFVNASEHRKTRNPSTFNEKTRYKMARDRRPVLTLFADKLAVREYVAKQVGGKVLTTLYATADEASQIAWAALPREFVAKVTHGSGGVVVVSEQAQRSAQLPRDLRNLQWDRFLIHPDALDVEVLKRVLNAWLGMSFSQHKLRAIREWAYRDIPHRIVVEEYVRSALTLPSQVLVSCFHGRAEELIVDGGDAVFSQGTTRRFLRHDFESARVHLGCEPGPWNDMLRMSAALAAPVDFVRVDWRIAYRGFVFGELTNYPAGGKLGLRGHPEHSPRVLDTMLGTLWTVPAQY